jgi:hypothetical protein
VAEEAGSRVRRSWNERLFAWVDALPGPTLLAYAALYGAWATVIVAATWASGFRAAPSVDLWQLAIPVLSIYVLVLLHGLDRLTQSAFAAFRPALDIDADQATAMAVELRRIPGWPVVIGVLATAGSLYGPIVLDVQGYAAMLDSEGLVGWMIPVGHAGYVAGNGAMVMLAVATLHRLRGVGRLHAMATRIDLFAPGPLHAFSRLTAWTGIGLLGLGGLVVTLIVVLQPPPLRAIILGLGQFFVVLFAILGLAIASFVLPLRGMQSKIADEKGRLQLEVDRRLQQVVTRIHAGVDRDDLARAGELQATLESLTAERDLVGKLRTWPWTTGTLRGFVSAVMLPIGLFLATRLLERLL